MSVWRWLGRIVGYFGTDVAIGTAKNKLGDKAPKAGAPSTLTKTAKVLLVCALASTLVAATCAREFGKGVAEGAADRIGEEVNREPVVARPVPPPNVPPNAVWSIEAPGRVCRTDLSRGDCDCWHDPADACDSCWLHVACASPSATPTPAPEPTATPTRTPVVSAPPTPTAAPSMCAPRPGDAPVSLIQNGGCPRYMEPLDFEGEGNVNAPGNKRLCAVKAGEGNRRTAWRLGYGLGRQGMQLTRFGDAWLQFDPGRGCTDAYGRHFEDCFTPYQHPEGPTAPYTWGGYEVPTFCDEVPPAPTPGPIPTPPTAPTGGVREFSWSWTNVSDRCRNFDDNGNGTGTCYPDSAHRYKGFIQLPNGEWKLVQNTVDRDHWHCAIEPCVKDADKTDAEWAEILQAHRDVYQLGGGDEWIVAQGTIHEIRVNGGGSFIADPLDNPYQGAFTAPIGAQVEARGCMAADAYSCPDRFRGEDGHSEFDCRPEHRRPVPGAGGCGPWKPYEVKP